MKVRRCCAALLAAFVLADALAAPCSGRVINPVTDVCWSCMFPIKVAGATMASSPLPDPDTGAPAVCVCTNDANVPKAGFNLAFWEPLRTVEIVRHPYCFPSLGGVKLAENSGLMRSPAHGRSASRSLPREAAEGESRGTAFYQAHWYVTPWLFVLEVLFDTTCLEQSSWDLAYMTELDPLWDDALTAFVLAPESALFANPVAAAACALDCTAAAAGVPSPELFWCNGCQGSLYPLAGWMAAMTSPLQAWHLIAGRMTVKLAREGLLWAAYGPHGQCGAFYEPIPRKDVWRTQLVAPAVTAAGQRCCRPLGAPTQLWGAGKSWPAGGEDGAILLWRRRDCCQSKDFF